MQNRFRNHLVSLSFATFLASCGGGGGGSAVLDAPPPADNPQSPQQPQAQAQLKAAEPGELVGYFKTRIAQRAAQGLAGTDPRAVATAAPTTVSVPTTVTSAVANAPLQEPGVDEDDLLKTDGSYLFAVHASYPTPESTTVPARLAASRIQPDGSLGDARSVTLDPAFNPTGLYHSPAASRVTVVSQRNGYGDIQPAVAALLPLPSQEIALDVFDVATGLPSQQHRITIDGRLVATRMVGNVLYVASSWQPDLSRYDVPAGTPAIQAQGRLATLTADQLLPNIRVDGATRPLVTETDCLLQPANASLGLQLTTITAIDLSRGTLQPQSRCYVGDATGLYMSPTAVYVPSSRQVWIATIGPAALLPQQVTTDIHKFSLQGASVEYRGTGEVAGSLGWDPEKTAYRMSEYNGDLRVLTFTGQSANASPATLTVLREDAAQRKLVVVSTLPNSRRSAPLGRTGEQVYGVQFAGPRAYVVTFRVIDPLYVLDLSDPADPRPLGELTVPGYTDYLFPLANGKVLGVGKDASDAGLVQGVKVALFDVADPAQPRMLASRTLGGRGSVSALDFSRHGISLLEEGASVRVALPVRLANPLNGRTSNFVQGLSRFVVDTAAGTLTDRTTLPAMNFDGSPWTLFAQYDIARDRAVQTANGTYYLSGGRVISAKE